MSHDIYGGSLRRGHCEVHPHVHESYPCSVCLETDHRLQLQEREYEKAMIEEQKQNDEERHKEWLLEGLRGGSHVL